MTLDEIRAELGKWTTREMTRSAYLELKTFARTSDFKDNYKQIAVLPEWKTITLKFSEAALKGNAVEEYEKILNGERGRGRISTEDVLDGLLRALRMPFADDVTDAQIVDLLDLLNRRSHGKFAFDQSPAFQKLTSLRSFAVGMFLGRRDDAR